MRSRINFYLFILALVVLDAVLLRSPNLLGKIGQRFPESPVMKEPTNENTHEQPT